MTEDDSQRPNKRQRTTAKATMINYYDILGVDKNATADELRKAYKKMAVKYHPDKHASKSDDERKEAEEKFKKMAEAYDVLNDEEKRKIYDAYGEEGLKGGGPPPSDEARQQEQHFQPGGGGPFGSGYPGGPSGRPTGAGYTYAGDPSEFFAHFTRASNQRQRSFGETPFEGPGGFEEMFFGGGSGAKRTRPSHVPDRHCSVPCTLEDMYRGRTRKMKITRKSLTPGRPTEKVLELPIKPGMKAGTKFTFSGEGDEIEPGLAENIIFVLREVKHERFVREGDDLHYEVKVSLADALCGFTHDIVMLDEKERVKRLRKRIPVSNLSTQVVEGEGMPISKRPGEKGDLIVSFLVEFPEDQLTDEQKDHIRAAFPSASNDTEMKD